MGRFVKLLPHLILSCFTSSLEDTHSQAVQSCLVKTYPWVILDLIHRGDEADIIVGDNYSLSVHACVGACMHARDMNMKALFRIELAFTITYGSRSEIMSMNALFQDNSARSDITNSHCHSNKARSTHVHTHTRTHTHQSERILRKINNYNSSINRRSRACKK